MGYPVVYAGSYYLDHLQLHWEDDLYSVDPGTFSEVPFPQLPDVFIPSLSWQIVVSSSENSLC